MSRAVVAALGFEGGIAIVFRLVLVFVLFCFYFFYFFSFLVFFTPRFFVLRRLRKDGWAAALRRPLGVLLELILVRGSEVRKTGSSLLRCFFFFPLL